MIAERILAVGLLACALAGHAGVAMAESDARSVPVPLADPRMPAKTTPVASGNAQSHIAMVRAEQAPKACSNLLCPSFVLMGTGY